MWQVARLKTSAGNSYSPHCGNPKRTPEKPGHIPPYIPLSLTTHYIYQQREQSLWVTWMNLGYKDYQMMCHELNYMRMNMLGFSC